MTQIRGWKWGNQGVDLYDDHLIWYEDVGSISFASGAACEQTLDDFRQRGPWVGGVPADVVNEVTEAVRSLLETPRP